MAKKLRIGVLFNQPVTGGDVPAAALAGGYNNGNQGFAGEMPDPTPTQRMIDLSEVGVVEEMEDIRTALEELGYATSIMNVDSNVDRLYRYLRNDPPDLVFNLVESIENESILEMNVAGIYELLKIPYTGAGAYALGTALNKPRVKEILHYHGIRTPRHLVVDPGVSPQLPDGMRFPCIVKPAREDASVGIADDSVVETMAELVRKSRYIHTEFKQPALVEEYIDGRELNIAILGNTPAVPLPISEIDFSGLAPGMRKIVSYEAKWMHGTVAYEGTRGVCPADLPSALASEMQATALRCFSLIGCRDYARVDLRLSRELVPYVLEVNPNPDISADAGFARSARAYGLSFAQAIGKIVEVALMRYGIS